MASNGLQSTLVRALLDHDRMSGKKQRLLLSTTVAAMQKAIGDYNIMVKST